MKTSERLSNTTKQTDALGSVCTGNYLRRSIENSPTDSKKELARQFRHEAYLRAREFRRTDPRQIAMKERLKERRREAYKAAKERNKEYRAALKNAKSERAIKRQTVRQDKLIKMIVHGSNIKGNPN